MGLALLKSNSIKSFSQEGHLRGRSATISGWAWWMAAACFDRSKKTVSVEGVWFIIVFLFLKVKN
jgi:hypothetical protein